MPAEKTRCGWFRCRKPWGVFAAQCAAVLLAIACVWYWLSSRYGVGVAQGKPCLMGKVYLLARQAGGGEVRRGDLVVFTTDERTQPYYRPGQRFVKAVRGVPGDRVTVSETCEVTIAGPDGYEYRTSLEVPVVRLLTKQDSCAPFVADYLVPLGRYFVMGDLPDSYDSRYWGLLDGERIIGKAYTLLK